MIPAACTTGTALALARKPGEQRLVQRLRHRGPVQSHDDLFDIERHTVAAAAHHRSLVERQRRVQRGDQRIGIVVAERGEFHHLDGPAVGQPSARPPGDHDQQPAGGRAQQRPEDLQGVLVEPVHVLRHEQCGTAAETGAQIGLDGIGDQLEQFLAFGCHGFVPGLRRNTRDRCQVAPRSPDPDPAFRPRPRGAVAARPGRCAC